MTDAMHLILIFEDDQAIQNVLRMLFEANGFRVVIADTAARGEHDAQLHRPDIIVVDLGLPDGDGLNVITAIRAWSPVPIIVLTARTAEAQRLAAFENGADDYVMKPFSAPSCRWACSSSATSRSTSAGASPVAGTDATCV
jgi:two-component system, OmpR family, KDP operon response regulator KdpE